MVAFTTPVALLVLELRAPRVWLRISLLALDHYALLWIFGFYASLVTLPHRLEEKGRGCATTRWQRVSCLSRNSGPVVQRAQRRALGSGDGLQTDPEDDGIYLATGGKTDLTLKSLSPRTVQGLFRSVKSAPTTHFAADEPERLASKLRQRIGERLPSNRGRCPEPGHVTDDGMASKLWGCPA